MVAQAAKLMKVEDEELQSAPDHPKDNRSRRRSLCNPRGLADMERGMSRNTFKTGNRTAPNFETAIAAKGEARFGAKDTGSLIHIFLFLLHMRI